MIPCTQTIFNDESKTPCITGECFNDDIFQNFTCDCTQPGFTGDLCELELPCFHDAPCLNNGTCEDLWLFEELFQSSLGYNCSCEEGFTGVDCEIVVPCSLSPCENGVCENSVDYLRYNCECEFDFTGGDCELFIGGWVNTERFIEKK